MGHINTLLLLSNKYKWKDITDVYLEESYDRKIVWLFDIFQGFGDIKNSKLLLLKEHLEISYKYNDNYRYVIVGKII